jgi:hypothetical protein
MAWFSKLLVFPNEDCLLRDTSGGGLAGEERVLGGVLGDKEGGGLAVEARVLDGVEGSWKYFGIVTGRAFGEGSGIASGIVKACLKFQAETEVSSKRLLSCVSFQVIKSSAALRRSSAGSQVSQFSKGSGYKV